MPKLPGWQASTSTSMPMKSPQLQGAPAMVKPAVQRFIPLENPDDYIRLGNAKASKYAAIGEAVNTVAKVGLKIQEEDEAARANNAVAQYSEEMAQWTTDVVSDPKLYTEQENPDGSVSKVYHWEDAQERYEEKAKEVQARLTEENGFKTSRAKLGLEKGFTVNDEQFRTKVQSFVADRRIDRGRSADVELLNRYEKTGNIAGIEALREDMIQSGRWHASTAYNVTNSAIKTASYTETVKQIDGMQNPGMVSDLIASIDKGEGWAKDMTVQQRQQAIAHGHDQLLEIHMGDLQSVYQNGGLPAAVKRLNGLSDGGAAASGAIDPVTHEKMMVSLTRSMTRMAKMDAARTEGQGANNLNGMYYGGAENLSAASASDLTHQLKSKGNQTVVNNYAQQVVDTFRGQPMENFYSSPVVNDHLLVGARVNYIPKPYVSKLESDIRGGSPAAVAAARRVDYTYPGTLKLATDVRERMEHIEAHSDLNLPGNPNETFAKTKNLSATDKAIYADMEKENFTDQSWEESFTASRERLGLDKSGVFTFDVNTLTDHRVEAYWKQTYKKYLPVVFGDHNKASDAATRAIQRRFGVTTANGDQRYEEHAPEVIYNTEGRAPGTPSTDFDQQYQYHIDDLNLRLEARDKEERYTVEDTRRQYLGINPDTGQHEWILHDMDGQPVMESDGVVFTMTFDPAGINAEADKIISNNTQGLSHVQTQEEVAANLGFEAVVFDDAEPDPITGHIAPTVTAAIDLNATRWSGLSDDDKEEHNWVYQQAFNALVDENRRLLFENKGDRPYAMSNENVQARAELQAHLFLATRGYMRGDVPGNYIRPPGGY
jgi:hypothetical protein